MIAITGKSYRLKNAVLTKTKSNTPGFPPDNDQ